MGADKSKYFKFFLALISCLAVRLVPFRVPNVEPIMATMMPFSKAYGALFGSSLAVLSILLYDIVTHTLGLQTFFTALAYGLLGLWSAGYLKHHKSDKWSYVYFAFFGTLFYDAFTGLTVGPIFFHQSFMQSFIGQIPFTALHLMGNIIFALLLSPAIYKNLVKKKKMHPQPSINHLNPKAI